MANNKSLQVLRGNVADLANQPDDDVLLDGQPLYIKDKGLLFIGDGETPIKNLASEDNPKEAQTAFVYSDLSEKHAGSIWGIYDECDGNYSTILGVNNKGYQGGASTLGAQNQAGRSEEEFNERFAYNTGEDGIVRDNQNHTYAESTSYAHVEGWGNKAKGRLSHVEGMSNVTEGEDSHVEGYVNNVHEDAFASHAEGQGNEVYGPFSHAEGYYNNVNLTAPSGHAEGKNTSNNGEASHTEGDSTTTRAIAAHAEGSWTTANGAGSHAEGHAVIANGIYSHAEGETTKAMGNNSHAQGQETVADGDNSTAVGYQAKANGVASFAGGSSAWGDSPRAEGTASFTYGKASVSIGEASASFGSYTNAAGNYSFAAGESAWATGNHSTALGYFTKAIGNASVAIGTKSIASGDNQLVIGKNNLQDTNAFFIIGNGQDEWNRDNLLSVSPTLATLNANLNVSGVLTVPEINSPSISANVVFSESVKWTGDVKDFVMNEQSHGLGAPDSSNPVRVKVTGGLDTIIGQTYSSNLIQGGLYNGGRLVKSWQHSSGGYPDYQESLSLDSLIELKISSTTHKFTSVSYNASGITFNNASNLEFRYTGSMPWIRYIDATYESGQVVTNSATVDIRWLFKKIAELHNIHYISIS